MSSVPLFTRLIGTNKQCPFPGAYIIVGAAGANGMVPVYTSMPFFGDSGNALTEFLNDKDAQVIVLPGYYFELCRDPLYNGTYTVFDNSGGTDILYRNASLSASSCKLFYKFSTGLAEIPTKLINSVTLSSSPGATTSEVSYNGISYRLYSFTASTHTVSLTDTAGVGVDCLFLLIGGGGGGGSAAVAGQYAGSGGGGAGAMVYGTIKLTVGATFNITVGAGGVGGQGSQQPNGIGSPSSISRTVGGTVDATLTVGGGGAGGGPGDSSTIRGLYPSGIGGSTGGPWPGYGENQSPLNIAANQYTVTGNAGILTVSTALANTGGHAYGNTGGAGGGGAGGRGAYDTPTNTNGGGNGGPGAVWPVNGITYAGGGGGNNMRYTFPGGGGLGGSGGGGDGGTGTAGAANTGSGGASKYDGPAGAGGSGICIIAIPLYRLA